MRTIWIVLALAFLSSAAFGILPVADHSHEAGSIGSEMVNDHSGRTNKDGCHRETKTGGYHCH